MPRYYTPLLVIPTLLLLPICLSAQVSPALQSATVAVTHPATDEVVTGAVWLSLPGEAMLKQTVAAIYDPGSPQYHKFLTMETLAAYLPTAAQLHAVQAELVKRRLTVTNLDPANLSVSFQGTVGDFQAAFHTTVEQHILASGKQVRAFTAAPRLDNEAAGLIQAVTGIGQAPEEHALAQPTDPSTGKLIGVQTLQQAKAVASSTAPTYCILPPAATLLTTPGQILPAAAYAGPIYRAPLSGGQLSPTFGCAYTPAQFYSQTGLDKIHAAGYTGQGQTIAILEEVGSFTIASDLAAFDQLYNLPAANLKIVNLSSPPGPFASPTETTEDVESAHAVAPDAAIVIVDGDLQSGLSYVIENHLADVVSISYGSRERMDDAAFIKNWNTELMMASGMGISVNVASGDYGDVVAYEGVPDVNVPADSPYATGVGGLSIAYVPGTDHLYKTSWGRDLTLIATNGVPLATPQPMPHGSAKFGSGGGVSTVFPVPSYQAALGGSGRHVPDVSDIADELTGLYIVVSDLSSCTSTPCVEAAGGTSLAAPVFSGKWTLLNQLHGSSLGQAAPLIAQYAGTPAIEDIVPLPGAAVTGATLSTTGIQIFSASFLASPETTQPFVSALWQPSADKASGALKGDDYVLSFGTDSSLAVTPGYDSATGWGQLDIWAIFSSLTPSFGRESF